MEAITAFPLCWPIGWERTKNPSKARFGMPFGKVTLGVKHQLQLMKATNIIISSNIPLKSNGLPTADFKVSEVPDAGVAVYFKYKERQMVFACDRWKHAEDNMNAIMKTIESVRGIERWGASEMMERAFNGFAQLEAPKGENWWEVLEVKKDASDDEIKIAWKSKAKKNHPDLGGSIEEMTKINQAYEKAIAR